MTQASDAEIKALCTAWNEVSPFRMGHPNCDWPRCKCGIAPKLTKHVLAALRKINANGETSGDEQKEYDEWYKERQRNSRL